MVELSHLPDNSVPEILCAFQEITTHTAVQTEVMTDMNSNLKQVISPEYPTTMPCSSTSFRTVSQLFIMPLPL